LLDGRLIVAGTEGGALGIVPSKPNAPELVTVVADAIPEEASISVAIKNEDNDTR
jgi:hypothetical protein